ncbi:MAG: NAD-dependent epimerase/dehydratase family protein [Anaplasmataceae bacterium]|nr:NAD-dependent epimerase/dehydratase family protein [Anaplasmataceae bacterium]
MANLDFLKDKKVLVTGATGFLGSNVMEELLKSGAKLRGTVHEKPIVIKDDRIEYLSADLTLAADCERAVAGMDYVIMCAASTAGAAVVEQTPLKVVTPNVVMNALMLEAAYGAGIAKFVFISSNAVYPPFEHPMKEEEMMSGPPFIKYYPVTWMKRFSEILCETYSTWIKKPMKTIVIRPANMYGPYDNFDLETSHVLPALMRKVMERHDPIEVWGDGKEIKDLIYVKDFVEGLLLALEKIENYDPINLGTGVEVTINQALKAMMKADGYEDAKISHNMSKPIMLKKRQLDPSKAEKLLGFKAKTSIEEGVAKTMAWYKEHYPRGYSS